MKKSIIILVLSIFTIGKLSAQDDKCKSKLIKVCPDTIVTLTKYNKGIDLLKSKITELSKQNSELSNDLATERQSSETDKFLNSEDTTIFSTNFKDLPDSKISPRSIGYYHMIKDIHELYLLVQRNNATTIRTDLDKMLEVITRINDSKPSPKNVLPKPLLEYYQKLVYQFGKVYDNIYPN